MKDRPQTTVFDLDKTLITGNISYLFGAFLRGRGYLSFFAMAKLVFVYALHSVFFISTEQLHRYSFQFFFQGKKAARIEALADEFIALELPGLFRESVLKRLEGARGGDVFIFSSSPDFLVKRVADYLLVAKFLATTYEIGEDGTFTKVGCVVDGAAKLQALSGISLDSVTAFSDSILDLPLLEKVGHPVAVFPDKKLQKVAKQKGWECLNR